MKNFKGKAIYQPSGKAAEYSKWACNFYVGCSNGCTYCYCKKGILAGAMGMDKPQLKKCFKDETEAFNIFCNEFNKNIDELKNHGIFLSFTTDPLLPETEMLTFWAAGYSLFNRVPVKLLTKCTDWVDVFLERNKIMGVHNPDLISFGFTLTGHDELEPNASTNQERIDAMRKLHEAGFKTFASIEPIINIDSSFEMIFKSYSFCDLFKIGLESGKKYSKSELQRFIKLIPHRVHESKIYFKDSLLKTAGIARENLPANCVESDFNIFGY